VGDVETDHLSILHPIGCNTRNPNHVIIGTNLAMVRGITGETAIIFHQDLIGRMGFAAPSVSKDDFTILT
jgi:hypothetical protein